MAKLLKSAVNRKLLEIIDHHGRVSRYVSDAASKEGLVKKSVNLDEPKTKDIGGKVQVRASIPKHLSNEVRIANMRNLLVGKEALFPPSMRDDEAQVPFEEVPGPKLLKHIANALTVIPVIGSHVVTSTIRYMIGESVSDRQTDVSVSVNRSLLGFQGRNSAGDTIRSCSGTCSTSTVP